MERLYRWEWFGMRRNDLIADPKWQLEHDQRKAEAMTLIMLIASTWRLL